MGLIEHRFASFARSAHPPSMHLLVEYNTSGMLVVLAVRIESRGKWTRQQDSNEYYHSVCKALRSDLEISGEEIGHFPMQYRPTHPAVETGPCFY